MDTPRTTTEFRVAAVLRQSNGAGKPAYLVRRGEAESGTILLKLNRLEAGCEIWTQLTQMDGSSGWMQANSGAALSETDANAYVERAIDRDPDLWVVEIEDREGINPFL